MTILADALSRVAPSATIAMSQKAREMRTSGRDIIALSTGEPDFDAPQNVKDAACAAIQSGGLGYPPVAGIAALNAAVRAKFLRENGLDYAASQILITSGAKQALSNALLATLNPGDEVIIPTPCWVSYPQLVSLFGGTPVFVPSCAEDDFALRPEALDAAITERTKWLILNTPNNPSGAVWAEAALRGVADVLLAHPHVWAMVDEIYEHIVYSGTATVSLPTIEPQLADRTLMVNGVSKAYAMTGYRIGYCGGPEILIRGMEKIQSQLTSGASVPAQWAAVEALTGAQDLLQERRESFRARRDMVVAALNAAPGLSCPTPGGAFYVFPSCVGTYGKVTPGGRHINSAMDFVEALLEEADVAVVSGEAFFFPDHFRISFAISEKNLQRACAAIRSFCEALESATESHLTDRTGTL